MTRPLPLLSLLLALAAPACSTSVALLATADTEGRVGGQLLVELGFGVGPLDDATRIEVSLGGGPVYDGDGFAEAELGLHYVDPRLDESLGLGHRVGLHIAALGSFDPDDDRDPLGSIGLSYSLLATLDGYTSGFGGGFIRWYTRDLLGVMVRADYRTGFGHGYANRVVFGLGPRYTHHVGDE